MASNVIETFSLTKRFSQATSYRALLRPFRREGILAVDRVSLQVGEGELFGLLGPNGAGKTTLVKMLCTLILPSQGHALVCGKDVVAEAAAIKPLIGLVDCQERSFFWRLSGRQNLQFFAALYGLRNVEARQRIDELLALVELSEDADHRFMNYSSGMRQKLAVARGLLSRPRVIFMDEPTRSLDPVIAHDLRTFIRKTLIDQLGHTVVLVTHRLEEAEELCDRVAIMSHGQIIACGPVAEIKRRIATRRRYSLRARNLPTHVLDGLKTLSGVVELDWAASDHHHLDLDMNLVLADEDETLPLVIRFIVSNGGDVQHCHSEELSLEDAFIHLVRGDRHGL
jgi:ABC-2 type transport system ATP-binding protein